MPGTTPNTHFLWDFWVYHDPAAEAHFWSSELDFYVVLAGNEFMAGSQCDFGDGYWATWDSQGSRWVLNGIACPHWAPGWHHVQEYDELPNSTQYRYDTLVFDGTGLRNQSDLDGQPYHLAGSGRHPIPTGPGSRAVLHFTNGSIT